ncbi:MAG: dUTP diphosphatase [Desulfobacteraceae bacterium]|nr:dUTP diphosphatase [Desulfobacteraceae bacterium]MCF8095415.1 dUTP diphosphatase [Desulfobacteraceae bacterium]
MPEPVAIRCQRIRPESDGDIPHPQYMTAQSAGMDMYAAVSEPVTLAPGQIRLIPTGFAISLPENHEAQIRPRSGLAVKHGIGLINAPGTIDADYRGEIQVALINHGASAFTVNRGDRIAQMVVSPISRVKIDIVDMLDESARNTGGFGHTGI